MVRTDAAEDLSPGIMHARQTDAPVEQAAQPGFYFCLERSLRRQGTAELGELDMAALGREASHATLDHDQPDTHYALPGQRSFPSTQVDTWFKLVLDHVGAAPPHGEVWTGHSLRKGAASASDAAGVSLARICHVGGWSIKSSAVKDYIDPTCPDSAAGRRYFGWLLPL